MWQKVCSNFVRDRPSVGLSQNFMGGGRVVFVKNRFAIFQASPGAWRAVFVCSWRVVFVCSWRVVFIKNRFAIFQASPGAWRAVFVCSWREVFVCSGRVVFIKNRCAIFQASPALLFTFRFRFRLKAPPRASRFNFQKRNQKRNRIFGNVKINLSIVS
ncbi:hypothetical protein [Methanimicrococcus hongohii]|uniref:hypothetical protein n=1 Tax=Methanimicrococcus hongohii TaxID=3028295 RepID=UPI00292D6D10|nr:hypothetical protein [Methanimicrococcus sp. Hf6]